MIVEPAPAKLNLALHVRRRRADGYHELETLFAFCRDGDLLTLEPAHADTFVIDGPFASGLGTGADNLVLRARDAFRAAFGAGAAWAIRLDKQLPLASGIGGGSADAAAMLRALARRQGIALDDPVLVALAAGLGADVPACLAGRTARGEGVGERLVAAGDLAGMPVLLVNPGVAVSTAAVFRAWDGIDRGPLAHGDPLAAALTGRNDLAAPACALAPAIGAVLEALAAQPGVVLARMSGSGATCFALFDGIAARDAAAHAIDRPGWWRLRSELA